MEILSPAGSYPALVAAVKNGADAVYMGTSAFNARVNARNFTDEEFKTGIELCKQNGVKVYAVLNTLIYDNEIKNVLKVAEKLTHMGVDAFIVQDMGLVKALNYCTGGSVPLHASTQMSIGNLDGVLGAADLGFSRVVLARELSRNDIMYISQHSPIELEIFVHGALCICYSGQCRMSAIIGNRSGNRGECAQPCRLPYERGYQLSLKDNCLLEYVKELEKMGISSLKIEGRMKGENYVGAVTSAYADAKRGQAFSEEKKEYLSNIFSRDGFTDGYYTNKIGSSMFGIRKEKDSIKTHIQTSKEYKRFFIDFTVKSDDNRTILVSATDNEGFSAEVSISAEKASHTKTDITQFEKNLSRLGGTPYELRHIECDVKDNFIPVSKINDARRKIIQCLSNMRNLRNGNFVIKSFPQNSYKKTVNTNIETQYINLKAVSYDSRVSKVWLPITSIYEKKFKEILNFYGDKIGVSLPMIIRDENRYEVKKYIEEALNSGIFDFLCGNIGHIYMLSGYNANLYGDTGLNITNALSKDAYLNLGLKTVTLSFELNMNKVTELADSTSGIIAYGRLPFMIMRNCIKSTASGCKSTPYYLKDRMNKNFPVTCGYNCSNEIWNSDKLWLADKTLPKTAFRRLLFTDENETEVKKVIKSYIENPSTLNTPQNFTRGLYYR